MTITTNEPTGEVQDQAEKVLFPEAQEHRRTRWTWTAGAVLLVVVLAVIAIVMATGAAGGSVQHPAAGNDTSASARAHAKAVTACDTAVAGLGAYGHPEARYTLASAYASTAAQVVSWDDTRTAPGAPASGESSFSSVPSSEVLSVCFVSGPFYAAPGAPSAGYQSAILVVMPGGSVQFDSFLLAATVPYASPGTTSQ
jgi:hypothetical protein